MTLTFSHRYEKLKGMGMQAQLVAVFPYTITEDTPEALLEYDTTWDGGRYKLRKGEYVLLLFLGSAGLFTTIRPRKARPWMPVRDKLEYYAAHIGEVFDIRVREV